MSSILIGGPLREVVAYVWRGLVEGEDAWRCEALAFWDGSLQVIDGHCFIVTGPDYKNSTEPDDEVLTCGHRQPVKVGYRGKGRKYYNRRRRCAQCVMEGK